MDKYDEAFQKYATPASDAPDKYDAAFAKYSKSDDYNQGRSNATGAVRGLLSALNGPTFGFGDELAGAVGGAYDKLTKGGTLADRYRQNRDYVRGAQDMERETNPWTTGITQAMASAPLGALKLFGTGGQAAMGLGAQTGRAAGTGAVYGALGGAGHSTAESVEGVAADAGRGGAFGATLGGAAVPVGRVMGAVGGNVMQRVNPASASTYAQQKVTEALARDGRGSVVQSGASNPVLQAQARLDKLGSPAVIADAGGQNTRQLLDTMATLPGQSKDAAERLIRSRQSGSAKRLIGAADDAMGTQGSRLNATVDDLITQRQQAAAPLYQQMHSEVIGQPSQTLQQLVMAADELGATKLGRQMSTARQTPYTLDTTNPQNWALRDLDHVKQGLDTLIAKQWDTANGRITPLGNSFLDLKNKLVGELDGATVNPQTGQSLYKAARDAFAGPSALIDAAKAGQASISKNEASITQITGAMSASELDAFKVGALEALREKIGRSDGGRTEVLNMWRNPATRDRLKAMFGDELSFRSFAATAAKEARLKGLESVGRGSQTASRQFAAGDLDVAAITDAGSLAGSAASGNALGMAAGAAKLWNQVKTPESVRDQIGRILMSGGQNGRDELQSIAAITRQINNNRASQAGGFGLLGSQIGSRLAEPMEIRGLLEE